ncbi:TBC1 domain family member 23-like isoform X1 [Amphibalanus amphitrite]|uniref:TBC1 domain family member 23-like isoform X1 n=1 Tax=Amphibalanus amphitrite TaxID=1232801 RepID=UPI001C90379E|nr:TBC1 domain family member 23-like isoform X1 [Amphibalanus amphitrite]
MASDGDAMSDDTSWTLELEAALLSVPEGVDVRGIAKCRPLPDDLRASAWLACLDIQQDVDDGLMTFTNIYDLPEQQMMREDIQQLVDRLGNDEGDRVSVMSDVESVLTHYCKSQRDTYRRGNGWMDILQPLVPLKLNKPELYFTFTNILQRYIPKNCTKDGDPYHLLRLLLLYHEPELCNFLDTMKVAPDSFATTWLNSLFAATCDLKALRVMWDIYFQMDDPFLIFFLSLVILVNAKDQILELKGKPRAQIVSTVASLPCFIQADDVPDFCELANFYSMRTPKSFRRKLYPSLFGVCAPHLSSLLTPTVPLAQSLCLPVYADEILSSMDSRDAPDVLPETELVKFFLVDCRPADQYNAGHLPTAFHLDCTLMLYEPAAFGTAVSALLSAQRQATAAQHSAAGEHLCFIGSGREKEDQFLHMVVASFLQKRSLYVSKVEGGYQAVHDMLSENLSALTDHSARHCVVCTPDEAPAGAGPGGDRPDAPQPQPAAGTKVSLIDRLNARWKMKGQQVKEKLVDIITNAAMEQQTERHVSSQDKGKRYRNMAPVFSLDDDEDGPGSDEELTMPVETTMELVEIADYMRKPELLEHFKCQHIKENKQAHPSLLLVTPTQLLVLREVPDKPGWARLAARRSLTSVVTITSKKKRPELITFKYGVNDGDGMTITDLDRFYIPRAGEATKAVKMAIIRLSDDTLGQPSDGPPGKTRQREAGEPMEAGESAEAAAEGAEGASESAPPAEAAAQEA